MGKLRLVKGSPVSKSPSLLRPMYERSINEDELSKPGISRVRIYICCFCNAEFRRQIAHFSHEMKHKRDLTKQRRLETMRRNRNVVRTYTCSECNAEFPQRRKLTKHKKEHFKAFVCTHCKRPFKDRMDLIWHDAINDGLQYETLNTPIHRTRSQSRLSCQHTFTQRAVSCHTDLFRRSDTPFNDTPLQSRNARPPSAASMMTRIGEPKRKAVSNWVNNSRYMTEADYDDANSEVSYRGVTPTGSWVSSMSHTSSFGKFFCSESNCMKTFPSLAWLTTHEMAEHKKLALFKCLECRRRFTARENLQQHMIENHPIAFSCLLCDQPIPSIFDYSEHFRLHRKYSYSCELCGKTFLSVYYLEEHMKNQRLHHISDLPKSEIQTRWNSRDTRFVVDFDLDESEIINGFTELKYTCGDPWPKCTFSGQFRESLPWRTL